MKAHEELELQRLNDENHVLGLIGRYILASNGVGQASDIPVNIWTDVLRQHEASKVISPELARIFMKEANNHTFHPWVYELVDMKLLEAQAKK